MYRLTPLFQLSQSLFMPVSYDLLFFRRQSSLYPADPPNRMPVCPIPSVYVHLESEGREEDDSQHLVVPSEEGAARVWLAKERELVVVCAIGVGSGQVGSG